MGRDDWEKLEQLSFRACVTKLQALACSKVEALQDLRVEFLAL